MGKETFYFSHDYNARNDPRLMRLMMKEGIAGIGIYWCIIEMLYEQDGHIPLINIESIAFELHTECDRIKSVLKEYDLFKFKDENFYSESVMRRLKLRNKKSDGARQSALKRWHPNNYKDANAMRTQCDANAIKESKGKDIKVKEIKSEKDIIPPTIEEVKTYCEERKNSVNVIRWYNFYEAKGWMIGKNKMKDWKAAVRTWENNETKTEDKFDKLERLKEEAYGKR